MTVTVVGIDGRPPAPAAVAALQGARLIVGWPRHVEALADVLPAGAPVTVIDKDLRASLDAVGGAGGDAVLLASGDPGFFGIVRAVRAEHDDVAVVPALSSVAEAFAAAGVAWDDAHVVSAHGRPAHHAVAVCRRFPKVAVLTEPRFGPRELGDALGSLGREFVVAERLGHDDELVTRISAADAAQQQWTDPNVVVCLDPRAPTREKGWSAPQRWTAPAWALADDEFEHRNGMVTKAEVRAVALAWLGPGLGDLVWDVGAGSGSVAVECARMGAAVVAVERESSDCARIHANAARHDVPVEVVQASAPAALTDLPDPDAVFVGGGGDDLPAILQAAAARARRVVVAAVATVERTAPALAALRAAGMTTSGTCVSASRLTPLGSGHRLAAVNPVFLLRGERT